MERIIFELTKSFTGVSQSEDGILRSTFIDDDKRAETTWSGQARKSVVNAAAAASGEDLFAKYPKWIEEFIEEGTESVLDAGCGYGRVAIPLLKRFPRVCVVGLDASDVMLKKFVEVGKQHHVAERILLYKGNLSKLPVRDETFDCCISVAVLLHLPRHEVRLVLRELSRVLKPGGKIILASSFPNLLSPEGLQAYVYERFRSLINPNINGPVRTYTKSQVRKLFSQWHDVQVKSIKDIKIFPRSFFYIIDFPFKSQLRAFEVRLLKNYFSIWEKTGIFLWGYDVVATKR